MHEYIFVRDEICNFLSRLLFLRAGILYCFIFLFSLVGRKEVSRVNPFVKLGISITISFFENVRGRYIHY